MNALSLLRLALDEKLKLDEQDSIILIFTSLSPETIKEIPSKSYVDSSHEFSRNRQNLSKVFDDQYNDFDNDKITNLDSITVNGNPSSDNKVSNNNCVGDLIGEGTIARFNQTLENYLKVSRQCC